MSAVLEELEHRLAAWVATPGISPVAQAKIMARLACLKKLRRLADAMAAELRAKGCSERGAALLEEYDRLVAGGAGAPEDRGQTTEDSQTIQPEEEL